MTWLIIWLIAVAIVMLAMAVKISALEDKLETCVSEKRFDRLADTHNNFVDFVCDEFDNVYEEVNNRIDDINNEFHNVYTDINYLSETDDTIVDVMELMCDTDDAIINRLNDWEDEICIINAEIDDIIKELFASKPEENKEKKTEKSSKKASNK